MENAPKSVLGSIAKGFAFTFFTGALMAGIFLAVSSAFAATFPALAALGQISAAGSLAKILITSTVVGLSTGTFGGLIQGYTTYKHNRYAETVAAAYSPTNGRDIAITAVSNNLYSPKLQAALERASAQTPSVAADAVPEAESTRFRDQVGQRPSINEIANRWNTSRENTSHTSRIAAEREAQAMAGPKTLQ